MAHPLFLAFLFSRKDEATAVPKSDKWVVTLKKSDYANPHQAGSCWCSGQMVLNSEIPVSVEGIAPRPDS